MGVIGESGLQLTKLANEVFIMAKKCGRCKTPPKGKKTVQVKPHKRRTPRKC